LKVAGFAGYSGAGKTHLVERLIPALKARGLRVSVVKHAHHKFDIDHQGKDTWRHREAGAFEVVVASRFRLALMREFERPTQLTVHDLIAELDPGIDWVLVEGFRESDLPKVEVWRAVTGQPVRYPGDACVLAIATDSPARLPEATTRPVLDLNAPEAIAQWLMEHAERFEYHANRHV
jgi:molybdopterin-guanine dinucleotide biosynthesis protein B